MTPFKQAWIEKLIGHKYAIDAKRLGDDATLAWSNLGYWQTQYDDYPLACQSLADQAADSIQLQQQDRVLDLGCGQGASVLHWLKRYHVEQLCAVELQPACIERIQKDLPQVESYCQSFLNLFLNSVIPVLNSKGRVVFHYLMWSDAWQQCSYMQKQQYRLLLKGADVDWQHLMNEPQLAQTLAQHGLSQIKIQDFSEAVLDGFARYIEMQQIDKKALDFAQLKINMTAKLCRKLYRDGLVRYVQISAVKS